MIHLPWHKGATALTATEVENQVARWVNNGCGNTLAGARMLAGSLVRRSTQMADSAILRMMGKCND